ncbi:GntR family transcriptional regulator [Pseudomonas sp. NPDC007930]|uniref:GntR family transcriptional regulator n=1 Tax=Pseudomonas sp. NPDC007930 TaxID=3364417 RepID=UPI0036E84301
MKPRSEHKPLAHRLAEQVREAIVSGRFGLGEALSEEGLAAAFAVSRTPVREALALLEAQGLVSIVPKSGTYVFNPNEQDITELCEHRVVLETAAMRLALARAPEALHQAMAATLEGLRQAVAEGDMAAYGRHDTRFHQAFFLHCENRYLHAAYASTLGRVATLRTHLANRARHEPGRSMADHERIVELVEQRRDGPLATLLSKHIMRTRENYIQALRDREEQQPDAASRMRRKLGI